MTVEANPETVTPELAALLREHGVTRVSLGAQSFQPRLLEVLERRATPDDVRRAVHTLRDAGFDNISLDLIYGIPGQSAADLDDDLAEALALEPEHLSCYELEAKPGTRFTHATARSSRARRRRWRATSSASSRRSTAPATAGTRRRTSAADGDRDLRAQHNLGIWHGARLPRRRGRSSLDARRPTDGATSRRSAATSRALAAEAPAPHGARAARRRDAGGRAAHARAAARRAGRARRARAASSTRDALERGSPSAGSSSALDGGIRLTSGAACSATRSPPTCSPDASRAARSDDGAPGTIACMVPVVAWRSESRRRLLLLTRCSSRPALCHAAVAIRVVRVPQPRPSEPRLEPVPRVDPVRARARPLRRARARSVERRRCSRLGSVWLVFLPNAPYIATDVEVAAATFRAGRTGTTRSSSARAAGARARARVPLAVPRADRRGERVGRVAGWTDRDRRARAQRPAACTSAGTSAGTRGRCSPSRAKIFGGLASGLARPVGVLEADRALGVLRRLLLRRLRRSSTPSSGRTCAASTSANARQRASATRRSAVR